MRRRSAPTSEKRLAARLLLRWYRMGMSKLRMVIAIRRRFGRIPK